MLQLTLQLLRFHARDSKRAYHAFIECAQERFSIQGPRLLRLEPLLSAEMSPQSVTPPLPPPPLPHLLHAGQGGVCHALGGTSTFPFRLLHSFHLFQAVRASEAL